jgi:hypothetical protein
VRMLNVGKSETKYEESSRRFMCAGVRLQMMALECDGELWRKGNGRVGFERTSEGASLMILKIMAKF